jgi:dCTP deaminase
MSFWSGETLKKKLPDLIERFDADKIDCAAYTLSVGPEVYVTPSEDSADPTSRSKRVLAENEAFPIPAGQFAFLLTEEIVTVPTNAIAFISIRAGTKFRGLVNVSGFHVDPGFRGRLVFSVFNAGPSIIHLQRGQKIFLIWYASLDGDSNIVKHMNAPQLGISPDLISNISRQLHSLEGLARRIGNVEREHVYIRTAVGILLTVMISAVVAIFGLWVRGDGPFRGSGAIPMNTQEGQPTLSKLGIEIQSHGVSPESIPSGEAKPEAK